MEVFLAACMLAWAAGAQSEQAKLGVSPAQRDQLREQVRHEKAVKRIADKHGEPPPATRPDTPDAADGTGPRDASASGVATVPEALRAGYRGHTPLARVGTPLGRRVGDWSARGVHWARDSGRSALGEYRKRRQAAGQPDPAPVFVPLPPEHPPSVPPPPVEPPSTEAGGGDVGPSAAEPEPAPKRRVPDAADRPAEPPTSGPPGPGTTGASTAPEEAADGPSVPAPRIPEETAPEAPGSASDASEAPPTEAPEASTVSGESDAAPEGAEAAAAPPVAEPVTAVTEPDTAPLEAVTEHPPTPLDTDSSVTPPVMEPVTSATDAVTGTSASVTPTATKEVNGMAVEVEVSYDSVRGESEELSLMCEDDLTVYRKIRTRCEREIGKGDALVAALNDIGAGSRVGSRVAACREQYQVILSQLDDLMTNTIAQNEAVGRAKGLLEAGQGVYADVAKDMDEVAERDFYISETVDAEDTAAHTETYEVKGA